MWAPSGDIRLSAFTGEFLTHAGQTYAPKTVRLYSDALGRLKEVLGDVPLAAITARDVDRFKTERRMRIQAITVNKELSTLRDAMNTALRWGHIPENPFAGVKMLRVSERTAEFLTPEDLARLLSCILDDWLRDVVLFAVATGMKQGEILSLRWRRIDLKSRIVHIENSTTFRTKTGRRRSVPLNALATGVLQGRRNDEIHPDEIVFTYNGRRILQDSLTHAFKRHVRKAGLGEEIRFRDRGSGHGHNSRHAKLPSAYPPGGHQGDCRLVREKGLDFYDTNVVNGQACSRNHRNISMRRFTSIVAAILVIGVLACDEDSPTIPEEPTPVEYEKPFLQKPAAGDSIYLPYTFDWASRHDYSSYRLQISDDTSFTNLLYDTDVGENLRYAPEADLPEGIMHWRVGGVEEDTVVWSETWPFLLYELRPLYQSRSCILTTEGISFLVRSKTWTDSIRYETHKYNFTLQSVELERTNAPGMMYAGFGSITPRYSKIEWNIHIFFDLGSDMVRSMEFKEQATRALFWMPSGGYRGETRDTLILAGIGTWEASGNDGHFEMRGAERIRRFVTSYHFSGSTWYWYNPGYFTKASDYVADSLIVNEDAFIRLEFTK